jgi:hypothetical protein
MRFLKSWSRRFVAENRLRNIEESNSVKRLSIFAIIFLPLSLPASILSIQDRFVDPGVKLYDFVVVFVTVGSRALLILILVRKGSRIWKAMDMPPREQWYVSGWWDRRCEAVSVYFAFSYFGVWAILLASFVIGMLKSVGLALTVMGFGSAGVFGPLILITMCRQWNSSS